MMPTRQCRSLGVNLKQVPGHGVCSVISVVFFFFAGNIYPSGQ